MTSSRLLTVKQAAEFTRLSASTLNKMRSRGEGPTYIKLGRRRVAYDMEDLNSWIDLQKRPS